MKKLINEYKEQIKLLDKVISDALFEIRLIRREGKSAMTSEEWSNVKKIADTKRQCYIQFVKNLEDYVA